MIKLTPPQDIFLQSKSWKYNLKVSQYINELMNYSHLRSHSWSEERPFRWEWILG